jgi:hypothetical protein
MDVGGVEGRDPGQVHELPQVGRNTVGTTSPRQPPRSHGPPPNCRIPLLWAPGAAASQTRRRGPTRSHGPRRRRQAACQRRSGEGGGRAPGASLGRVRGQRVRAPKSSSSGEEKNGIFRGCTRTRDVVIKSSLCSMHRRTRAGATPTIPRRRRQARRPRRLRSPSSGTPGTGRRPRTSCTWPPRPAIPRGT